MSSFRKKNVSIQVFRFILSKGQIKPKADLRAVDSPKKQTKEFGVFAVKSKKATKTNSFVCFLVLSVARQSAFGFI